MQTQESNNPRSHKDSAWCALYTRHQHEKVVAGMLSAKGFEVFLPLYDAMRRWKDRNKTLSLPLFPGYVFVRAELTHRLQVLSTPGVHMILCVGDHVATIPEEDIRAIRKTIEEHFRVEPHPFLKCGERVRVRRGALAGIEGVLVRKKNRNRLVLSLDLLAQSVGVEIDASDVESVSAQRLANAAPAAQAAETRAAPETLPHGCGQRTSARKEPIRYKT